MLSRRISSTLLVIIALVGTVNAEDRVQSELRFAGHNKAEKTAGVWVDGQYVGSVKELSGDKKIMLLPGKHDILVRQAWYQDYAEQVILEPGKVTLVNVSLVKSRAPDAQGSDRGAENRGYAHSRGGVCGQSIRRPCRRI